MPRNQYIFIDHENVSDSDLSRITCPHMRVFIIIGAQHKKLPVSLFLFAQDHPQQLRLVQTPVSGRNALDLVLAVELGRILATDPHGYFHIVSKDTDFISVVRHLKGEKRHVARHESIAAIPALRTAEERLTLIGAELVDATKPRPSTRKTLENKIRSVFENKAEPDFVEKVIGQFVQKGVLSFTETDKVTYAAA